MADTLEDLLKIKEEYNKKVRKEGEGIVKNMLADFLAEHPDIEHIKWDQYTPYFNDGEPCTFSVNEAYVKFNDADVLRSMLDKTYCWETKYLGWNGNTQKSDHEFIRPLTDEELMGEGGDNEDGFFSSYSINDKGLSADISKLNTMLHKAEDILEMVFGDHVTVTAGRDKIDTEEYDHE